MYRREFAGEVRRRERARPAQVLGGVLTSIYEPRAPTSGAQSRRNARQS